MAITNLLKPEEPKQDLKDILADFWLDAMQSAPDWSDKMKASELLAKYLLGDGKQHAAKRKNMRPSTAEILKLATQLETIDIEERDGDDDFDSVDDAD